MWMAMRPKDKPLLQLCEVAEQLEGEGGAFSRSPLFRAAWPQNSPEGIRAQLMIAGEKLVVFEIGDWLLDRWPRWNERRAGPYENYRTTLELLRLANFPAANLVALLEDPNPKVRTLAMALLFDKD